MTIESDLLAGVEIGARLVEWDRTRDRDGRGVIARLRFAQGARKGRGDRKPDAGPDGCHDWPEGRTPAYIGAGDPTGEQAIRPDQAAADLRAVARAAAAYLDAARKLDRILANYTIRPPSIVDLAQVERDNVKPEPGCSSCIRVQWHPAAKGRAGMCEACYRLEWRLGRRPTVHEVEYKHSHGRWPNETIRAINDAEARLIAEKRAAAGDG